MKARGRRRLRALLVFCVVLLAAAGAGWLWVERNVLPELDARITDLRTFRPLTVCRVLDANGEQIDDFYIERRIWAPLDEVAVVARQAVVAAEDRRFYEHPGIDILGILRAAVVNIQAGDIREGGSTVTQQVVKNLVVGSERSYQRKLEEALLAWRLEKVLTKDEILELYVNLVYLGSGNYGLEAAAQDYFGVSASQLDAGQAALLAGLIPAPSRYSPRRDPEAARIRRDLVLRAMVLQEYITADQALEFGSQPVEPPRRAGQAGDVGTAYITSVRREVRRLLGTRVPVEHGLTVVTAYDANLQAIAEQAVEQAAAGVEARQGIEGPRSVLASSQVAGFLQAAPGLARDPTTDEVLPPEPGACFPAMMGASTRKPLRAGPFEFPLVESEWGVKVRSRDPDNASKTLATARAAGQVWDVCLGEDGTVVLTREPWVEGAAVVIENATGRIVAITGGRFMSLEGFLRAEQARRQPGSSFKPYVYAAALLAGRAPTDKVLDAPISLPAGGGRSWSPKNYSGGFSGQVPLSTAMALSLNTVAVRLAMETGPESIVDVARRMGVRTPLRTDLTVALGSSEVTALDQAIGMATIARGGVSTEAHTILEVRDLDGVREGTAGGPVVIDGKTVAFLPGGSGRRVLPGGVAAGMVEMLTGVVERGTARKARDPDQPRFGKTGTASDFVDAWFVGATPTHSIAVWIGTDGVTSLGPSETGGRAALPAWLAIADALPKGPDLAFPVPDDVIHLNMPVGRVTTSRSVPARVVRPEPLGPGPLPAFPTYVPAQR